MQSSRLTRRLEEIEGRPNEFRCRRRLPKWVIRDVSTLCSLLPICPNQQTFTACGRMSQKCHKQTDAVPWAINFISSRQTQIFCRATSAINPLNRAEASGAVPAEQTSRSCAIDIHLAGCEMPQDQAEQTVDAFPQDRVRSYDDPSRQETTRPSRFPIESRWLLPKREPSPIYARAPVLPRRQATSTSGIVTP